MDKSRKIHLQPEQEDIITTSSKYEKGLEQKRCRLSLTTELVSISDKQFKVTFVNTITIPMKSRRDTHQLINFS